MFLRAIRLLPGNAVATLDQAMVSGTRFVTTWLVARVCGVEQLGAYSLGHSLVMVACGLQAALMTIPYTLRMANLDEASRVSFAGAVFMHQVLLSALISIGLVIAGSCAMFLGSESNLATLAFVLAAAMPFILLQEYARRISLAHSRVWRAMLLDSLTAALQIGGLLLLIWWNASFANAAIALALIGCASAIPAIVWCWAHRSEWQLGKSQLLPIWTQNWVTGRWLVASGAVGLAQTFFVPWLLTAVLNLEATGEFAACNAIVSFTTPVIMGIRNLLTTRFAQSLSGHGAEATQRSVFRVARALTAFTGSFLLLMICCGNVLLRVLFDVHSDQAYFVLILLAVGTLCGSLDGVFDHALCAFRRNDLNLRTEILGFAASLIAALLLVGPWQVLGATLGLQVGNATRMAARLLAFRQLEIEVTA